VNHASPPCGPSNSYKLFASLAVAFSPTAPSPNPFSCNTYGLPRKCCKQKTYGRAKSFSCNTYKKQGGGGPSTPKPATRHTLLPNGLKSFLFAFLRTLLRSPKTQPFYFQAIPHSLSKITGGGGYSVCNFPSSPLRTLCALSVSALSFFRLSSRCLPRRGWGHEPSPRLYAGPCLFLTDVFYLSRARRLGSASVAPGLGRFFFTSHESPFTTGHESRIK